MFVNTDYLDYHYLVEVHDNYIILAKNYNITASFDSPTTYPVVIQYLNPSNLAIETSRTTRQNLYFESIEVTDDFYARADCPTLMLDIYSCIFFILFLINGLTRFVKRGGIFFGD